MKDRFQQRQRGDNKLFDEHTLEPVQVAMRRMLAVKLEDDMYVYLGRKYLIIQYY